MELFKAHNQWSTRPADERFATLAEMGQACYGYYRQAQEYNSTGSALQLAVAQVDDHQEPVIMGHDSGRVALISHWAFGQLAQRANAPADFLRELPAQMAAEVLAHRLGERSDEREVKLLLHSNGNLLLRAITGVGYQRFWNWQVVEGLQQLQSVGWKVPPARPWPNAPAAFTRIAGPLDVLEGQSWALSVSEGSLIAPAGLYASGHDLFAFMVNQQRTIQLPGSDKPMYRGFFVEHSEVGDSSYRVTLFLYAHVCGNHIVWGAENVREIRIPHKGDALERIAENLRVELKAYADSSATGDQQKLQRLATLELGASREEVIGVLFQRRLLSQAMAGRAYDTCESVQTPLDGSNPRTPWGIAQGLTQLSQGSQYGDQRTTLDRMAGKVLEVF